MDIKVTIADQKPHGPFEIAPCCSVDLGPADQESVDVLFERLTLDEPALKGGFDFGALITQGVSDCPSLLLGDQREIGLFDQSVPSQLDYRMAGLARPGDLVVVNSRNPAFETYLEDFLKLTGVSYLEAGSTGDSVSKPASIQCREDAGMRSAIERFAKRSGAVNLIPYLTTGNVWLLGQKISKNAGVQVNLCGPMPRISRRVNDKTWFANVVRALLGPRSIPPVYAAYGPAGAAGLISRLCKTSERVVVKIPDSAGSAGNFSFKAGEVRNRSLSEIKQNLLSLMHERGWRDRYPLQIGVWESNVTSSPSAQMWIPHRGQGTPVIEGIFEQVVEGAEGTFIGARSIILQKKLQTRFLIEALKLATLFQRLGYFGRCSLDAIVAGADNQRDKLHWIECNGRWGGVSIPLTLANGLSEGQASKGMVVVQQTDPNGNLVSTEQFVTRLKPLLYERGVSNRGIVLLSPCESTDATRLNFLSIAETQSDAENLAEQAMAELYS